MTEQKRTEFAMAAVDLAGLFNAYFQPVNLVGYQVQLTAPEGQSTGGGIQARQNIVLVDQTAGKRVVVGACNTVEKTVELRTHAHVAARFGQRYEGMPFPVPAGEFDGLRQKLTQFFSGQGFQVATATAPKAQAAAATRTSGPSVGWIVAIGLAVAAIAGALVWFFVFRQA
jgi:hypothetical protein